MAASINVLTLKEILDEVEQSPRKKKDVASEFGIPQSTLSTILKDKEKLRASYITGRSKRKHNNTAYFKLLFNYADICNSNFHLHFLHL